MKNMMALVLLTLAFAGCASEGARAPSPTPLPPGGLPLDDNSIVRGRAYINVESNQEYAFLKFLQNLINPTAIAATGSVVVTYTNAAAVSFTLNAASLVAGAFTGTTLSLGTVTLATIDDNNLKICNPGGNTKCTQAVIRVYNTGATAGFINTADLYGAPVYAGSLNPSTALGLLSAGSVQVQTYTIPGNKNRVRMAEFPSPTYAITSDFANAGAGDYSMTLVVEYALLP